MAMQKETMAKDCIHGYVRSHGKRVDDQNTMKMKTTNYTTKDDHVKCGL